MFRIATYNVYGLRGWQPQDRRSPGGRRPLGAAAEQLAEELTQLDLDVLALQECASSEAAQALARRLGMRATVFPSPLRWPGAVLSREATHGPRSLAQTAADEVLSRSAGIVEVEIGRDSTAAFVAVHLHPKSAEVRREESERLLPVIEQALASRPHVIVLGDFNSDTDETVHRDLTRLGFANGAIVMNCRRATRHAEPGRMLTVDHIYLSAPLVQSIRQFEVIDRPPFGLDPAAEGAGSLSDHVPVVCELAL